MSELITELKKPSQLTESHEGEGVHSSNEDTSTIVRSVMYKYNKSAHARFFRVPELCYLLIYFSVHPVAKELTERKLETKPNAYQQKILGDIARLAKEALIALHESESAEKSQVFISLARQLQYQSFFPSDVKNLSLNLSSLSAGGSFIKNIMGQNAQQKSDDSSLMLDSHRSIGQILANSDTDEQMTEQEGKPASGS